MAFAHIERSCPPRANRGEGNRCFADWHSERNRSPHDEATQWTSRRGDRGIAGGLWWRAETRSADGVL